MTNRTRVAPVPPNHPSERSNSLGREGRLRFETSIPRWIWLWTLCSRRSTGAPDGLWIKTRRTVVHGSYPQDFASYPQVEHTGPATAQVCPAARHQPLRPAVEPTARQMIAENPTQNDISGGLTTGHHPSGVIRRKPPIVHRSRPASAPPGVARPGPGRAGGSGGPPPAANPVPTPRPRPGRLAP